MGVGDGNKVWLCRRRGGGGEKKRERRGRKEEERSMKIEEGEEESMVGGGNVYITERNAIYPATRSLSHSPISTYLESMGVPNALHSSNVCCTEGRE